MPAGSCLFCRIVRGEIPAKVVRDGVSYLAIEDINPKADTHLLVLPKRHLESFREVGMLEPAETKEMLEFVAQTARDVGLDDYRLIVNVGQDGGQTVMHLHWHVLGGRLPRFG